MKWADMVYSWESLGRLVQINFTALKKIHIILEGGEILVHV